MRGVFHAITMFTAIPGIAYIADTVIVRINM